MMWLTSVHHGCSRLADLKVATLQNYGSGRNVLKQSAVGLGLRLDEHVPVMMGTVE